MSCPRTTNDVKQFTDLIYIEYFQGLLSGLVASSGHFFLEFYKENGEKHLPIKTKKRENLYCIFLLYMYKIYMFCFQSLVNLKSCLAFCRTEKSHLTLNDLVILFPIKYFCYPFPVKRRVKIHYHVMLSHLRVQAS